MLAPILSIGGNIRVTVDQTGTIVTSADDYYPFGIVMEGRSVNNGQADARYKFTGKERDTETDYDYFPPGRTYLNKIGRWMQVDPWAEKYPGLSPYAYTANNPVRYYDPNGKGLKDANGNEIRPQTVQEAGGQFLDAVTTLPTLPGWGGVGEYVVNVGSAALNVLSAGGADWLPFPSGIALKGEQAGVKLLKSVDEAVDMGVDVVRHYTDDANKAAITALAVSTTNPFPGPEDIVALGIAIYAGVQATLGIIDMLTENTAKADATKAAEAAGKTKDGSAEGKASEADAGQVSGKTIEEIESGNSDWVKVSAHTEGASKKGAREQGVSVQEVFENKTTGERVVRHRVFDDKGRLAKIGHRPYYKPRPGDTK